MNEMNESIFEVTRFRRKGVKKPYLITVTDNDCVIPISHKARAVEGYSHIHWKGKSTKTHRVVYELYVSPIKNGLHVLHKCDNPPCINPQHLFLGTNIDNIKDKFLKGRVVHIRGEANATSKLTEEKVLLIRHLCKTTTYTYKQLAEKFNVDKTTIFDIYRRHTWKHIKDDYIYTGKRPTCIKITLDMKQQILQMKGKYNQRYIARLFNISQSAVWKIFNEGHN